MNIIFIAPPAAGKGTFSTMLKEKYGYHTITRAGKMKLQDMLKPKDIK